MPQLDGKQIKDAPDGIATAKINDGAVDTLQLATDAVTEIKIEDSAVTTGKINDTAVTEAKLHTSVAGDGLTGGGGSALAVGAGALSAITVTADAIAVATDDATLEDDGGTPGALRVKDLGITEGKLANLAVATGKIQNDAVDAGKLDLTDTYDFSPSGGVKVKTPAVDADAANKGYVDAVAAGLQWKESVVAATTGALALATDFENGDTLDTTVTLSTGDRILIKDQATGSENGIYIVEASGPPTRADDLPATSSAAGVALFIEEGTTLADTAWVCTNDAGSDVVGTDALVFAQFSGGASYSAGDGIDITGTVISADLGNGLKIDTALIVVEPTDFAGDGLEDALDYLALDLVAGGGLKLTGSTPNKELEVEPNDFAGTGLEDDGSDNLQLAAQGNGIAGGAGSTLSVLADPTTGPSVAVDGSGVRAAVPYIGDKEQAPADTSGNDFDTGLAVAVLPADPSNMAVFVNGLRVLVGDAVATKDCYFADPGALTTPVAISAIKALDRLIWNGTLAGYQLKVAKDLVDFDYAYVV